MNERAYMYEANTDLSCYDRHGQCKPYVYQSLLSSILERHLKKIQGGYHTTVRHGLVWVLVSMVFHIDIPMTLGEIFFARTWYAGRKGPYYRREFEFLNHKEQSMVKGTTFSVLLNIADRSVYRKKTVPFYLPEPQDDHMVDASPRFASNAVYMEADRRIVRNSHTDLLGHVNNARYGEYAYDVLDSEERSRVKTLSRMECFFRKEAGTNIGLTMYKAQEHNRILVRGSMDSSKESAFDIAFVLNA